MMLSSLLRDILMLLTILFPMWKFVPSHPFLVVMIILLTLRLRLVYWSTLKIANDSLIFASYFSCLLRLSLPPEMGEMAQTSLVVTYFWVVMIVVKDRKSVSIIFKNWNRSSPRTAERMIWSLDLQWLTYFCVLLSICCFFHLIGLFSVTWLFLLHKFTRFLIYFLFLFDEGPTLETLDFTIRIVPWLARAITLFNFATFFKKALQFH